jgi:hypothetical protein
MRSEGLLKFLLGQKALTEDQLSLIWSSCSSHDSILIAFYKVLAEIASCGLEAMQFFIAKIV